MDVKKMPVLFVGHGSPMIALDHNELTRELGRVGRELIARHGRPAAILAISAHWYTAGTRVQTDAEPRQVYDMYGFPRALYEVKYPVKGCAALSEAVLRLLGDEVSVDDSWGIDHSIWTPLVHMFPGAEIPIVQLSVDGRRTPEQSYALGRKLAALREEGYLIVASGNVVHNLRRVDWNMAEGSEEAVAFDEYILERVQTRDDEAVINWRTHPCAAYAVPTPEHFLPLLYALGASREEKPMVFNKHRELAAISMTSFAFGL